MNSDVNSPGSDPGSQSAASEPATTRPASTDEQVVAENQPAQTPCSQTPSSQTQAAGAPEIPNPQSAKRRDIKIGSERHGSSAYPQFKPLPTGKPLPLKSPRDGVKKTRDAEPDKGSPAESTGDPAKSSTEPSAKSAEPSAKSIEPATESTVAVPEKMTFPPPRTDIALPPDLQTELDEALAGISLDELIFENDQVTTQDELQPDSRQQATVAKIHRDNVFVDLGGRNQGIVPLKNFDQPPEVGQRLDVIIQRFLSEEGLYEISVPGQSVNVGDWSQLAEGILVDAVVTGHNKGGLEIEVSRIRGFIPISQISLYRVEDLEQFVGEKFACVVTEANEDKRNLVLSRRAVLEREKEEQKEKLMQELEVGQTREGVVRKLMDFGAFVDLGGVDGLIHISQMSWDRVKHPSEVLSEGQQVNVKIEKIDHETGKIGLAYRDQFENPWTTADKKYPASTTVQGTVSRIMDFGAFVKLEPGIEGLVHISELSHKRVFRVSDVLAEGQVIEVQIVSVDTDAQRIGLSLRALEAKPAPVNKSDQSEESEEPEAAPIISKRTEPLKGGVGSQSADGNKFGLKW